MVVVVGIKMGCCEPAGFYSVDCLIVSKIANSYFRLPVLIEAYSTSTRLWETCYAATVKVGGDKVI